LGLYGEMTGTGCQEVKGGFPIRREISCGTPMVAGDDTNGGQQREQWPRATAPSMQRGARLIVYVLVNRSGHGQRPMLLDQWERKEKIYKRVRLLWNCFLVRNGCNQFCIVLYFWIKWYCLYYCIQCHYLIL
jgi:hypothetical protein